MFLPYLAVAGPLLLVAAVLVILAWLSDEARFFIVLLAVVAAAIALVALSVASVEWGLQEIRNHKTLLEQTR